MAKAKGGRPAAKKPAGGGPALPSEAKYPTGDAQFIGRRPLARNYDPLDPIQVTKQRAQHAAEDRTGYRPNPHVKRDPEEGNHAVDTTAGKDVFGGERVMQKGRPVPNYVSKNLNEAALAGQGPEALRRRLPPAARFAIEDAPSQLKTVAQLPGQAVKAAQRAYQNFEPDAVPGSAKRLLNTVTQGVSRNPQDTPFNLVQGVAKRAQERLNPPPPKPAPSSTPSSRMGEIKPANYPPERTPMAKPKPAPSSGSRGATAVASRLQSHRNPNVQVNSQADVLNPDSNAPGGQETLSRGRPVTNAGSVKPAGPPPPVKDPVSGQPMQKGKPVPTAYSGTFNQKVGLGIRSAGEALNAGMRPANAGAKAGPKVIDAIRAPLTRASNSDAMQSGFDSVRQVGDMPKKNA